jgi:hypothetical protein
VTIQLQGTQVATAKTDNNGAFTATITIPASAQAGNFSCNLCVNGNTSGASVYASLTIVPTITISPQKGPSGTSIIVNGIGFYMYDSISINWFDPATNTQTFLKSFGMSGSNSFQQTVTAPSNLTSGNTYDVQVVYGSGSIAQVPFQAT